MDREKFSHFRQRKFGCKISAHFSRWKWSGEILIWPWLPAMIKTDWEKQRLASSNFMCQQKLPFIAKVSIKKVGPEFSKCSFLGCGWDSINVKKCCKSKSWLCAQCFKLPKKSHSMMRAKHLESRRFLKTYATFWMIFNFSIVQNDKKRFFLVLHFVTHLLRCLSNLSQTRHHHPGPYLNDFKIMGR